MSRPRLKSGQALDRIVKHASKIELICRELDRESFLNSPSVPDAVGMNLIAIGQWLTDVRDDDQDTFSAITGGNKIIGLRHILAHDYAEIDFDRIWSFIVENMPTLLAESVLLRDRYVEEYNVPLDEPPQGMR